MTEGTHKTMLLGFHPDLWPELLAWLENCGMEVGRAPDNMTIRPGGNPVYLARPKRTD